MSTPNKKYELISYVCQILLILLVIIISLINLTMGYPHQELWISLLSSSIGYILPGPKLSKNKKLVALSLGDYHAGTGGGRRGEDE